MLLLLLPSSLLLLLLLLLLPSKLPDVPLALELPLPFVPAPSPELELVWYEEDALVFRGRAADVSVPEPRRCLCIAGCVLQCSKEGNVRWCCRRRPCLYARRNMWSRRELVIHFYPENTGQHKDRLPKPRT